MINGRTFEHRPINELFAIVKQDLYDLDSKGLIDEGRMIKTIMYCNDKLGIPIREVRQACIPVVEYEAKLPRDFEKLYYAAAVTATNSIVHNLVNPFNNKFDRDIIYEAEIDRESLGGVKNYSVNIKRGGTQHIHYSQSFIGLDVNPQSLPVCHSACPNTRTKGRYTIEIVDDHIRTPFRSGEIYIMYLGTMTDDDGNLLFPFHPMITPYYEWMIKEKVLTDAIYNAEGGYGELLKDARNERLKAWLEAFDMTTSKGYGEYVAMQRQKELGWYNQWFKYFQ